MKKISFIILLFSYLLFSCSKDSNSIIGGEGGDVVVKFSTNIGDYSDGGIVAKNGSLAKEEVLSQSETNLDNDFYMVTELSTIPSGNSYIDPSGNIVRQDANRASTTLGTNFKYHLLVFKQSTGAFVADRVYSSGSESSAAVLRLDGGVKYTFVAYSFNSTEDISALTDLTHPSTRTIGNYITSLPNDKELLFYKDDLTVPTGGVFTIPLQFKRMYNRITVEIDASATGYNVTNITGLLKNYNDAGSFNLSTTNITRSNGTSEKDVGFNNTPGSPGTVMTYLISSFANIIPTAGAGTSININPVSLTNLTIGPLTQGSVGSPIRPTFNLPSALGRGRSYKVKITIKPKDQYIDNYGNYGYKAVRINGQVWMRHNLGANMSADPDLLVSAIHGGYYQWGRNTSFANGTSNLSSGSTPSGWSSSAYNISTAWNSGTETAPVKTVNDPCPNGYRVPTMTEMWALVSTNTTYSFIVSTSGTGPSVYDAGAVFTSKRNSAVKVTFPAQGYYGASGTTPNISFGSLIGRGQDTYALSSSFFGNNQFRLLVASFSGGLLYGIRPTDSDANTATGHPVRCVAVDSTL